MVTVIKKPTGSTHPFYEYACVSTDVKPVSLVPENSLCREIDTGKKFYFSDGAWHEAPGRGGSGGDGGLPDNFPAEGSANANKFLGFDANGDYEAKNAPSGGGAEKFVVTLTEENDTWTTADGVTIAEIVAADEANQVVVAKYPEEAMYVELPLNMAMEYQGVYAAMFIGLSNSGNNNKMVSVMCSNQGSGDNISVQQQDIPTSTNAPLVVTMTADQSTGNVVGDKTFAEIHAAATAGRTVVFAGNSEGEEFVVYCTSSYVSVEGGNTIYQAYYNNTGDTAHFEGGASDYPSFS